MRPGPEALERVRAALEAGQWPTVLELGEVLRGSDCDPGEARDLLAQYGAAVATLRSPPHSGEASVLAALRGFSIDA